MYQTTKFLILFAKKIIFLTNSMHVIVISGTISLIFRFCGWIDVAWHARKNPKEDIACKAVRVPNKRHVRTVRCGGKSRIVPRLAPGHS